MKKIIMSALAVILILVLLMGAWWYWTSLHVSPSRYLPASTLVYTEIPDGLRTAIRFQNSQLKKIVEQPECKNLGALLVGGLDGRARTAAPFDIQQIGVAGSELVQSLNGTSFFALVPRGPSTPEPAKTLLTRDLAFISGIKTFANGRQHGLNFWPALQKAYPPLSSVPTATLSRNDLHYVRFGTEGSAYQGFQWQWKDWLIVSNDDSALFDFMDRVQGRIKTKSLQQSDEYRELMVKGLPHPDLSMFIRYGALIDRIKSQPDLFPVLLGKALDNLKVLPASGWTMSLADGDVQERTVLKIPVEQRQQFGMNLAPTTAQTLRFTTPSTLLYSGTGIDFEKSYSFMRDSYQKYASGPNPDGSKTMPINPLDIVEGSLKMASLDLHENILKPMGSELAFMIDWPVNQSIPDVFLVIGLKDSAAFDPALQRLTDAAHFVGALATYQDFVQGDYHGFTLRSSAVPWASPTLFANREYWGLGLAAEGTKRLLSSSQPLSRSSIEQGLHPNGPATSLLYMDVGALTQRTYSSSQPYVRSLLGKLQPDKHLGDNLPSELALAPLLGQLRSVSSTQGDYVYSDTRSSCGTIGTFGLPALLAISIWMQSQTLDPASPVQAVVPSPLPAQPSAPAGP